MRIFRYFTLPFLFIIPIMGFNQTVSFLKNDSINLCVLEIDFVTYNFVGGNISYYKKCSSSDTLPVIRAFDAPSDFGRITFKTQNNFDTIFDATIVWSGTGKIKHPTNFDTTHPFVATGTKVPKPNNLEYFDWNGNKVIADSVFIQRADSAWNAISSLEITNRFYQLDYKAGIYLYPPSVGLFEPWKAKWIIFLYHDNTEDINYEDNLVYPNPFKDIIFVNSTEKFNYKIFSINGDLIRSGELKNNRIELGDIATGIYNLSLISNARTINKKIEKNNR